MASATLRCTVPLAGARPPACTGWVLLALAMALLQACEYSQEARGQSGTDSAIGSAPALQTGNPVAATAPRADSLVTGPSLPPNLWARVMWKGKWGMIDGRGQWVVEPEYDWIEDFEGTLALAMRDSVGGVLDTAGGFVRRKALNLVGQAPTPAYRFGLMPAPSADGRYGFVDRQGVFRIAPQFESAGSFDANGLALVKQNQRYGFVDTLGKWVLKPQALAVVPNEGQGRFRDGLEPAQADRLWGYLNLRGQWAIKPQFTEAHAFFDGRAMVRLPNASLAFINRQGKIVTWLDFDDAQSFSENRAPVKLDDRWGYIDTTGRVVILPKYTKAAAFTGGLAAVQGPEGWGLIDAQGNELLPARYQEIVFPVAEGPIPVCRNNRWGFVYPDGRPVGGVQFQKVLPFRNGLAWVQSTRGWWGALNLQGNLVLPLQYDELGSWQNGLAAARQGQRWGFVDSLGNWVVAPRFEGAGSFHRVDNEWNNEK